MEPKLENNTKKVETIRTYDLSAREMAKKFENIGPRVLDIDKTFSYVEKENPVTLEIGCGNGRDAREILKHTKEYTGLDISQKMIEIAKEGSPEATFLVADIENCNIPKNLDVVFSFASLLHSDKNAVKNILQNIRESLHMGGVVFISLKEDEYQQKTKTDEFGTRTYYFYTPELIEELAGSGYKALYKDRQDLRGQKWFSLIIQKI